MEATGTIHAITPLEQLSDKFRKRELILTYAPNPMYPQYIRFEFAQACADQLDHLHVGQVVTVSFDLAGRQWTSPQGEVKYFTTLRGWRVQAAQEPHLPPATVAIGNTPPGPTSADISQF